MRFFLVFNTDIITNWIKSIIRMQGDNKQHLELCYDEKNTDWLFILPEHRCSGYGKEMYLHLEKLFKQDGVKRIYITSDPITGKPFWKSLGFVNTGEKSPENHQEIYEKQIFTE